MKPPFAYYGGKQGMAQKIIDLMPPHRVYFEPFAGSLAVLFAKRPVAHEIVNDKDGAVVNFFRVLRDRTEDLERACALSPHARQEWEACSDLDAPELDELERARLFWVRANQSFAKAMGARSGWSVTVQQNTSIPRSILNRLGRFADVANRLAQVTFESCDAWDLIDRLATRPDTVVYVDPPYLHSERRSGRGWRTSDYRCEMEVADHVRLAESLNRTPAAVLLSGYPSALYEELYPGWATIDFQVMAFSSNAKTDFRSGRLERIWMNRPPATLQGTLQFVEEVVDA